MNRLSISEWVSQNRSNLNWKHCVVFALLIAAPGMQEVQAQFAGGNGTPEDPYQIETFTQLNRIRDHLDSHFILLFDIDMQGSWIPIGTEEAPFTGSLNGNGKTIKDLSIFNTDLLENVGLFGKTNGASITNLNVTLDEIRGFHDNVGVLVGFSDNSTNISSCRVSTSSDGEGKLEGSDNAGGLVGFQANGSTITKSRAEIKSIFTTASNAGGLVGRSSSSTITNSYSNVRVKATTNVGGLIGFSESSTVTNSYSVGKVIGFSTTGGFIGKVSGTNANVAKISNSYSASKVKADTDNGVGLFLGALFGDTGGLLLESTSFLDFSGLPGIGETNTNKIKAYSGINATLNRLTQAEMQQQASFTGFDFIAVWQINEGSSYPFLRENPQTPPPFVEIIPEFAGGDGSPGNPFQIEFPEQLDNIRDYPDSSFVLVADIDLDTFPFNLGEGWNPVGIGIGFPAIPFTGTIDGGGYTISNLYVNTTSNGASLLGFTENCSVQNLNFEYATVMGAQRTGILASQSTGCAFENISVRDQSFNALPKAGTFSANEVDSLDNVVSGTLYVGGLVGYVISSTFDSVFVEASVSNSGTGTGGIAGILLTSSSITNSASAGIVQSEGNSTGGIAGENLTSSLIRKSYSTSQIDGGKLYSGGLVGNNSNSARIANSYALGFVSGKRDVGGLVGRNRNAAIIDSSYSAGLVSGDTNAGGLAGSNNSQVNNSFWNTQTSGFGISVGGAPFSDDAMKAQDSLSTLIDFTSIWTITEGSSFPYLQSNTPLTPPTLDIPQIFAGGTGTAADPYQISTVSHLSSVRNYPNSNFSLQNNLSLEPSDYSDAEEGWVPIGSESFPFTKTFTGNDFTISNLFINRGISDNVGFFGYVENGMISNLNLANVNVTGNNKVGGLVGYQNGAGVEHSTVTGSVTGENDRVGGLVGNQEGATVTHSTFNGSVTGDFWVGGLVGFQGENSSTTNSSSDALVNGTGIVGGLVGNSASSGIEKSFSTSEVHATGDDAGGLVGINSASTITESYYAGEGVFGDTNIGGLAGENTSSSAISNSYSIGEVEGTSHVGGFVGLNSSSNLTDNYSAGLVTGIDNVGGFLGEISGIASESVFWNTQTSGQGASPGTASVGLTNTQAKQQASYTGFDFAATWGIDEGSGYPFLLNVVQNPGPVLDIPEFFAGGSGTESDPYLVSTPGHLNNVKRYLASSYRQVSDIDMNVQPYNINEGWYPIGSGDSFGNSFVRFEGEFDGDGYSIKYLFINRPTANNAGLFGWTEAASITNVHLQEANVTGKVYTGALVGRFSNSMIDSSSSSGDINGTVRVGGLIGSNETSDISRSSSKADVRASGSYAGGLVGRHDDGMISESYSTGEVNGNDWVGGLIGFMAGGSVSNSYSTSSVTGDATVGGFIGNNSTNGTIENVYSSGLVTGNTSVGGLTGLDTGTLTGGWWNTESSGQAASASGTGLTDAMTKMQASFTGFDFTNTWAITETETFPFLQQNIQSPGPGIPVVLPDTVLLSSPSDDSLRTPINLTLAWGSTPDAISYHIQVSSNMEFTSIIAQNEDAAGLTFELSNLENLATYYWRVRAENEFGFGEWSAVWSFTTTGLPPARVVLNSPTDSLEGVAGEPTLAWNSAETAISYSLQVSASEEFTAPVIDEENLADTSLMVVGLEGLTTYYWRVRAGNEFGNGDWSEIWQFTTMTLVSNEDESGIPEKFSLSQNYPNPFNPSTNIRFELPKAGLVTLEVFNMLGQKVATIVNEQFVAGTHTVRFDGSNLSSGVYIYRVHTSGKSIAKKLTLIK